MHALRTLLRGYLHLRYEYRRATGSGAFGAETAIYLRQSVSAGDHPLKHALFRHYVRQFHESSCSVASVAMVINALRDQRQDSRPPITQLQLLDRVSTGNWKQRMSAEGDGGKRGLPLPLLGQVVASALETFGLPVAGVHTVQAAAGRARSGYLQGKLRQQLERFESRGDCLIIAHFDQGVYVRALNIPHISPVGGFDPRTGRVTVLDVDPTQPGPYAVGFDTFYQGLASQYHHLLRPFGYDRGGVVLVDLSGGQGHCSRPCPATGCAMDLKRTVRP
jgi:hypothetical protein